MGIDSLFMEFVHGICVTCGPIATPFLRLISLMGEKAWVFLLISLFLCLRKRTRWIGLTAILAIFLGFIIADVGLKPLIMRMRPYTASNLYQDYWLLAGAYEETNYSMPSGHTLGCAAFFISLYITSKKSARTYISTIGTIMVILMIISRTYFMHHYLTDCLVSILIAVIVSYLSKFIIKTIYKFLKKNEDIDLFNFILNFDLFAK